MKRRKVDLKSLFMIPQICTILKPFWVNKCTILFFVTEFCRPIFSQVFKKQLSQRFQNNGFIELNWHKNYFLFKTETLLLWINFENMLLSTTILNRAWHAFCGSKQGVSFNSQIHWFIHSCSWTRRPTTYQQWHTILWNVFMNLWLSFLQNVLTNCINTNEHTSIANKLFCTRALFDNKICHFKQDVTCGYISS